MSVPIATSPGRSGFGPQLSLSYDSGAGNGPFGFGWSLSLPSITRKTDKGLPQYRDAEESDVFILSGAEDLVPVFGRTLTEAGSPPSRATARPVGFWVRDQSAAWSCTKTNSTATASAATARASRACSRASSAGRKLGAPAMSTGARSPRTTSSPLYGKDANSRIADPVDRTPHLHAG